MTDPVKPTPRGATPRRYDSSRRQAVARRNRTVVLQSARRRFLDQGYAATTLAQIAADADVSVETLYKSFASKGGVLKALFDVTVAGDDEPVPIAERDTILDIVAEPDPVRKIEMYTRHLADAMPRSAPIQLVARDAAASDDGAAAVWEKTRAEMLDGMSQFAQNLAATGRLRVDVDEARDVLWTYHATEIYELLVLVRGWSPERYGNFLRDALVAALVSPG